MMVKVSVLMPVYNASEYLSQAIESILNQSFQDWELIIINDGSTDNSEDIIRSYPDTRIKYSKNEDNKGLIYTRNRLIGMATGEYIAFLDSDDIARPERLDYQVSFLDRNPDYALCGTWSIMIDKDGKETGKINLPPDNEEIKCSLLFINTFVQSSIMIRRQLLIDNPYNECFPLAEDYELWCRLSKYYKLKNLPIHLTEYRWHNTNISQSKKEQLDKLTKDIYRRELNNAGLLATEEELQLHLAIKDKTTLEIPDKIYLKKVRIWLKKLAGYGLASGLYDNDILFATIAFRWIFICKTRKIYFRALSLPVSLNLRGYRILFKMLKQRI